VREWVNDKALIILRVDTSNTAHFNSPYTDKYNKWHNIGSGDEWAFRGNIDPRAIDVEIPGDPDVKAFGARVNTYGVR
jgi:hypothetical protein